MLVKYFARYTVTEFLLYILYVIFLSIVLEIYFFSVIRLIWLNVYFILKSTNKHATRNLFHR